jgi:CheY-like chemotaxis protein
VQQVLLNLGTNAAHAMADAGGVLEITARHAVLSASQARLSPGLREGDYVTISVRDTGHGMDDETSKRVFDPFFTTKPPGKGTGLGLSVAHGIMRLHGGAITVYSEPGRGTIFTLYFPASDAAAQAQATQAPPSDAAARGAGELILCVDDDPALLAAMGRRLERSGYRTVRYADPRAALEDFRARPDDFALVLTDYSMPDLSGRELAVELLRLRPGLPVILMSGFLGPEEVEAVKAAGVRHVALKPDVIGELDVVVPRLLSGLPVPGPNAA